MASKLFDSISLEEIEEANSIRDSENYVENSLALDNHFRGISQAFEEISYLNKIRNILIKNKSKGLSKAGKILSTLAVENITSKLNLDNVNILSLESLNTSDSMNVAIESIGETIRSIWKAIVDTFKYIWEKIKSFFLGSKHKVKVTSSKAKRNHEEIKELVADIKKYEVPVPDVVQIQEESLLKPLKYLNKNLSEKDVLDLPIHVLTLSKILSDLIHEVEKLHVSIEMNSSMIQNDDIDSYLTFCKTTKEESNFIVYKTFTDYVANLPFAMENDAKQKALLNEALDAGDVIKSETVKLIDGFINGGSLCMFSLANRDVGKYLLKNLPNCEDDKAFVTIAIPSVDLIESFSDKVLSMNKTMEDLSDLYNAKFNSLNRITNNIYINIGRHMDNIPESGRS
jgi:hypothetical protein